MLPDAESNQEHPDDYKNMSPWPHIKNMQFEKNTEEFVPLMLVGEMLEVKTELLTKTTKVCVAGIEQSKSKYDLHK